MTKYGYSKKYWNFITKGHNGAMRHTIQTMVIYGDSISTTEYGGGGYEGKLKKLLNCPVVYNYAVSGSGLSAATPDNLVHLLKDEKSIHKEADLIILWHGTNDWYWGAELGEAGMNDQQTFIGAYESVIQRLRDACPQAEILCLTPIYRYQAPDQCSRIADAYENKNIAGHTLKDYYDAIIELSERFSLLLMDMKKLTGFNEKNRLEYLVDNVHPSSKGYDIIARVLYEQIQKL